VQAGKKDEADARDQCGLSSVDTSSALETEGTRVQVAWPPPTHKAYGLVKRALDLVIAGTVLFAFSPVWVVIGLLIRLTSKGPALYRGRVVGKDCVPFTYFKFRSMRAGDDSHHREWLREFVRSDRAYLDSSGIAIYKAVGDPRVTPIGRFLRRLSLDEVPQLINVLRGEMTVVGPRPPIPAEFEMYNEVARRRLAVKPGITGLSQVTARSQVPFSGMLAIDLDYIRRRSTAVDVWIMLRTAWVMVRGQGAG
jgi:lipopolysaccharide/colanic/teichoic acid biosynthesis glycosyltransferase